MFYNWRKICGYNAPVTVVISRRGLGKTFERVKDALQDFVEGKGRFVYVVETIEDVKTLSQNKGERFFSAIDEFYRKTTSNRAKRFHKLLFEDKKSNIEEGETELVDTKGNRITGGTIKVGDDTAGYLIALNSYGNLKRNNFVDIKTIIIDEFIPEEIDIRHLRIARKVASVIQTIARRQNVKIYMLGNSIRLNDILLTRLGLDNMRLGEIRQIKDGQGLLVVGHYVDPAEYPEFEVEADKSVAGRLAKLLGEDNLDKNEFRGDIGEGMRIPDKQKASHLLVCIHDGEDSLRLNTTKDRQDIYVMSDYGKNINKRICFDKRFETPLIMYQPDIRESLLNFYKKGHMFFESGVQHLIFRKIMKLETNV